MFERIAAALPKRTSRTLWGDEAVSEAAPAQPAGVAHNAKAAAPEGSLRLKVPDVFVLHEQPAGDSN